MFDPNCFLCLEKLKIHTFRSLDFTKRVLPYSQKNTTIYYQNTPKNLVKKREKWGQKGSSTVFTSQLRAYF